MQNDFSISESNILKLDTPVLFIIFNRPETTKKVFDAIRLVKPKQLFIAADGFRIDIVGEKEKCEETRRIATSVDWDCDVSILFQENNLGCGLGPTKAISWFFEHVEEGIILEDDCLPNHSFFTFCEELLKYHRNDKRIMHISGNNFHFGKKFGNNSYYFSMYSHNWGWATWKRAWVLFDYEMKDWIEFKNSLQFFQLMNSEKERFFWEKEMQKIYNENKSVWDYQWMLTIWVNNGLAILPNVNLVSNIGFGSDATHTHNEKSPVSNVKTGEIKQIKHPNRIMINKLADRNTFTKVFFFQSDSIFIRLKNKLLKALQTLHYEFTNSSK